MSRITKVVKGDQVGTCIFLEDRTSKMIGNSSKRVSLFECSCGNEFEAHFLGVKSGNTKSCGCLRNEKIRQQGLKNKKHGYRNHILYKTWTGMIRRCSSPKDQGYKNYGGRGIKVDSSWLSIDNFIEDMFPSFKEGLELDRIDVNGNYCKENCIWVTRKQNMNNTRRNRLIEYGGVSKTISQWSDDLGIPYKTLIARLNRWDVEKSFNY